MPGLKPLSEDSLVWKQGRKDYCDNLIIGLAWYSGHNIGQIIKWSVFQMVFWKADKIVHFSDHGLNNRHYRASEFWTNLSTIQTIIGHLNSRQEKVCCSDVSAIQIFTIQIHTVFKYWSCQELINSGNLNTELALYSWSCQVFKLSLFKSWSKKKANSRLEFDFSVKWPVLLSPSSRLYDVIKVCRVGLDDVVVIALKSKKKYC